jgi:hypothetical protein
MLNPSPANPNGYAAFIDMIGAQLDFGDLFGDGEPFIIPLPDLQLVNPGVQLKETPLTFPPVYLDVSYFGFDNHLDPGNNLTEGYNPLVTGVKLTLGNRVVDKQTFLFDTGAQLSTISTAQALALGLDLSRPETTITVEGVAGAMDVAGYTLDELIFPTRDGGLLRYTEVPVYVLDIADGIDGIFGMNLLNVAHQAVYDPFNPTGPQIGLTFFKERFGGEPFDPGDLNFLNQILGLRAPVLPLLQLFPLSVPRPADSAAADHATLFNTLFVGAGLVEVSPPLPVVSAVASAVDRESALDQYFADLPVQGEDAQARPAAARAVPLSAEALEDPFAAFWATEELFR